MDEASSHPTHANPPSLARLHDRISEKSRDASAAPVLIVALGDSVTMGCTTVGKMHPRGVYHARLKRQLEKKYPDCVFSVINSGVGGTCIDSGLTRLDRDVIRHQPDLVLEAYGLNDACRGLQELETFRAGLRAIIQRVRDGTDADLILLTPNFIAARQNPRIAPEHQKFTESLFRTQNTGVLAAYADAIREIGAKHNVAVADVYAAWADLARQDTNTDDLLINGLNHPTADAHAIASGQIMQLILQAAS